MKGTKKVLDIIYYVLLVWTHNDLTLTIKLFGLLGEEAAFLLQLLKYICYFILTLVIFFYSSEIKTKKLNIIINYNKEK